MAKLFVVLAIIATLAAAALGFLAKGNIDKLQNLYKETKQTLASTKATLSKTEAELKKALEDLGTATTKIEAQTTEITGLKKDKEDLTGQLTTAKTATEAKIAEFEAYKTANPPRVAGPEGTPMAQDDPVLVALRTDLAKSQSEAAEQKQMVETLNKVKVEKDEQLAASNKEVERYKAGFAKTGLTGKILAVNPGWNFVVLSVGDRQGAATGALMIVTRGGDAIGKARITSVEPATSIADIIPGSVRKGVSVQPGDTVVYEGPRSKSTAPVAAPGPVATP